MTLTACANSPRGVVDPTAITTVGVPPEYVPAFEALGQAVSARENASARAILTNLRGRLGLEASLLDDLPPARREAVQRGLQLTDGYDNVLSGRERVDSIHLTLELRDVAKGDKGHQEAQLALAVTSDWSGPLELTTGPAALLVHTTAIDAIGRESHRSSSLAVDLPEELELTPGEEVELPLGAVALVCAPGAIGVRHEWELRLTAGFVTEDGEGYPAMRVFIDPCEATVLDGAMPRGAVGVDALIAFITEQAGTLPPAPTDEREVELFKDEQRDYTLRLLALALRVPGDQRLEALRRLAEIVEPQPSDFVHWIVPALRWLSREGDPGRDPAHWRRWLLAREWEPRERAGGSGGSTLEMPSARPRNGAFSR